VIEPELPSGSIVTLEYLSPIGETLFADLMEEAQKKYPDVKIGSYPELDEATNKWRCKLTFTSSSEEAIAPCRDQLLSAIQERAKRA
jgi:molybdopterin-biosynthesis enzyme MoeA-like protein